MSFGFLNEMEVILPPNTRMIVTDVEACKDEMDDDGFGYNCKTVITTTLLPN